MMPFDLVGIGNPVYDVIVTPWSKTTGRVLSGCSTNACLAAKKLGMTRVGLTGCIGKDFSEQFMRDMAKYGIRAATNRDSSTTGGFHLIYDRNGNRTLDVLGVAGKIGESDYPEEFLDSAFILVGPILGEVDLELFRFLRSNSSARIFLDPQGLVRTIGKDGRVRHSCDRSSLQKIIELVDFVKPNEQEIETITGEKDPFAGVRRLQSMGSAVPIVTLAERGSLLLDGNDLYQIPPYPTSRAIDPTGAGDVYGGAFITEYVRTGKLSEAALFASAAASMMVEQVGPDFYLGLKDVEDRKVAIRNQMRVETLA
jgi:sugar/nucleoside kinase (ribokinase family)